MLNRNEYLLGIDLGTTNVKANLMGTDGSLIATASRPNHLMTAAGGYAQQDANEWWRNTAEILREITAKTGRKILEGIRCISISSQVISLLPVDEKGTPLYPAMIWMDTRSHRELNEVLETVGRDHYIEIVGGQPSVAFLPGKILWFKRHEPELFQKTRCLLQANGYLNYKLTGCMSLDLDSASRCQCLDIRTMKWSGEIADAVGADLSKILPEPVPCTDIIGTVTTEASLETGLPAGIPVAAGASDAMASLYAAGLSRLGDAGESSGTTSLVFAGSDHPSATDVPVVTKPCSIAGMPYIFDAPINASGASLKWFLDLFCETEKAEAKSFGLNVYDYLNMLALKSSPGSGGLFYFPYLSGERAPLWNSYAKGMFIGMTMQTDRNQLIRSVFEGTAYAVRHVIETVKASGAKVDCLRITGGGAKSRTWNQIKASVLRIPVLIPDERSGDVPFGDVLIAGCAAGIYTDLAGVSRELIPIRETFEPDNTWADVYDELFPHYTAMYQHLDSDLAALQTSLDKTGSIFTA